jgi:hypothetical protein
MENKTAALERNRGARGLIYAGYGPFACGWSAQGTPPHSHTTIMNRAHTTPMARTPTNPRIRAILMALLNPLRANRRHYSLAAASVACRIGHLTDFTKA